MKIVIISILLLVQSWADTTALFGRVVNIDHNDTLNVRSQPDHRSKKVGALPLDAYVGIETRTKAKKRLWCRVYPMVQQWYEKFGDKSHIGWVNSKYLKFHNSGYVIIDGKKNCDYALRCKEGKCEIIKS